MLPAATVRALNPAHHRSHARLHDAHRIAFQVKAVVRRKGASKAGTENKRHRKHGTPGRRKGWVRSAASLGGPDPGATRRLCPGRIARALLGFIFEEVLEDLRPGEFRWNCDASIPASLKANPDNPRKIQPGEMSDAALAASIKAVGILQPPAVTEEERRTHHRLRRPAGPHRHTDSASPRSTSWSKTPTTTTRCGR